MFLFYYWRKWAWIMWSLNSRYRMLCHIDIFFNRRNSVGSLLNWVAAIIIFIHGSLWSYGWRDHSVGSELTDTCSWTISYFKVKAPYEYCYSLHQDCMSEIHLSKTKQNPWNCECRKALIAFHFTEITKLILILLTKNKVWLFKRFLLWYTCIKK